MKVIRCLIFSLVLACFLCSGCAHLFSKPKTEESLRARVNQEWEAKMKGDWGTVYDLTSREFQDKVVRNKFAHGATLDVKGFSIKKVEIDSDQGKAAVQVSADLVQRGLQIKGVVFKEDWIWEKGEWRLNLKPNHNPFEHK